MVVYIYTALLTFNLMVKKKLKTHMERKILILQIYVRVLNDI